MSKKEAEKDKNVLDVAAENTVKNTSVEETFNYGVSPFLTVIMIKGKKAFRFEMPIGTHYNLCVEACEEVLKVVKSMRDEGLKQQAEIDKKAEEKVNPETPVSETPVSSTQKD